MAHRMVDKSITLNSNDDNKNATEDAPFVANEQDANTESLTQIQVDWSKLQSAHGILAIFGTLYWLVLTIIAFSIQFKDVTQSWLFKWAVISLILAFCCQFSLIAMVITGYDDKITRFRNHNYRVTMLTTFPYSVLICIDLFIHVGATFIGEQYISNGFSIAFIVCHGINLFVLSIICFEWKAGDKTFRYLNFIFEWIDIFFQILVILLYSAYADTDNRLSVVKAYWAFTFIQLLFWIPSICLGISRDVNKLLKLVFYLDIFTDVPIVIITLASGAYTVQVWIFIDLIFKVLLMIRGIVYNGCIYMLLPRLNAKPKYQGVELQQRHQPNRR